MYISTALDFYDEFNNYNTDVYMYMCAVIIYDKSDNNNTVKYMYILSAQFKRRFQ